MDRARQTAFLLNLVEAVGARIDRALGLAFLRLRFRLKLGYRLDLVDPKTANEKIQWRKFNDRSDRLVTATDKYAMRALVRDLLGEQDAKGLFAGLYQFASDREAIRFGGPASSYVVKPTHGCGWIEFVTPARPPDEARLRRRCRYWQWQHEWAYSRVTPQIMIEEFIADDDGVPASDLKFYVMGGRTVFASSLSGRQAGRRREIFFHRDGRVMGERITAPPPAGFDRMLQIAGTVGARPSTMSGSISCSPARASFSTS